MVSHVIELFEIDNFSVLPTLIRMVKSKMVGLLFAVVIPIQFSLAICGIIVFGFQRLDLQPKKDAAFYQLSYGVNHF